MEQMSTILIILVMALLPDQQIYVSDDRLSLDLPTMQGLMIDLGIVDQSHVLQTNNDVVMDSSSEQMVRHVMMGMLQMVMDVVVLVL
jgi:hypothetical protein